MRRVPDLRQRGENDCLTSAVLAILFSYEADVSWEEVADWCGQQSRGCILDLAIHGLSEAGIDVDDYSRCSPDAITSLLNDPDEPLPVLVTLLDPRSPGALDHAVVVVSATSVDTHGEAQVEYMDPAIGNHRLDPADWFWTCWDFAGSRAFVIRPPGS